MKSTSVFQILNPLILVPSFRALRGKFHFLRALPIFDYSHLDPIPFDSLPQPNRYLSDTAHRMRPHICHFPLP